MGIVQSIAGKANAAVAQTTKAVGDGGEALALRFLLKSGLLLVARNFKTPRRGGGEVDLIMRSADDTLIFVEVRQRKSRSHGGAAASISAIKRRRIVYAAQHYISRLAQTPPCRFDVIALEGTGDEVQIEWLKAAFDAS